MDQSMTDLFLHKFMTKLNLTGGEVTTDHNETYHTRSDQLFILFQQ